MKKIIAAAALLTMTVLATSAPVFAHDLGFAGLLSKSNRTTLPALTLGVGKVMAEKGLELKSGGYYVLQIISDGSGELAVEGPGFFRAIWINEIVVNDLEIRPYGVESIEFDEEGMVEIKFVAIKPGQYFIRIPGTKGDSQRVNITIR